MAWRCRVGSGARSAGFTVAPGDWQELTVEVPAKGLVGTTRLYLPAGAQPVELDWVEITTKGAKPQRWEFNAK